MKCGVLDVGLSAEGQSASARMLAEEVTEEVAEEVAEMYDRLDGTRLLCNALSLSRSVALRLQFKNVGTPAPAGRRLSRPISSGEWLEVSNSSVIGSSVADTPCLNIKKLRIG